MPAETEDRIRTPKDLEKVRAEIIKGRSAKIPCISICGGTACRAAGSERSCFLPNGAHSGRRVHTERGIQTRVGIGIHGKNRGVPPSDQAHDHEPRHRGLTHSSFSCYGNRETHASNARAVCRVRRQRRQRQGARVCRGSGEIPGPSARTCSRRLPH